MPSLVDPSYELIDPCPDIHALFVQFDTRFFGSSLQCCEVKWSPRMYSCAGICSYEVRGGRGGLCSIRLSQPLLKLRPRKDLVETLLHEMIHAYLFVKERNRDRDGHGPQFQAHMNRINSESGTNITIYHTFHDEVALYKQHVWRCEGSCRNRRPFFGYVKRSSNRAPGPNDRWWSQHQANCGGQFIKIKEPEGYGQKRGRKKKENETKTDDRKKTPNLDDYFGNKDVKEKKSGGVPVESIVPFSGTGQMLGGGSTSFPGSGQRLGGNTQRSSIQMPQISQKPSSSTKPIEVIVLDDSDEEDDYLEASFVVVDNSNSKTTTRVICPSCNENVLEILIHDHLDHCLG
ncbi:unnamed protein product [Caenorhabditis angaria]|uniref:Protein with SprT-like domain at the N terminus n=1 Tax=Caenorhabditis angaria TaxID=860376 RepID=A0A9P1N7B8_9PELO|nr:unnamed protein product [Caenorhabditis angaria]